MKKKYIIGLMVLVIIGIIGIAGASAFPGKFGKAMHSPQQNEAAQDAIAENDYDAFVTAISADKRGQRMAEHLTEERFSEMVERRQHDESVKTAVENQDYETWKELVSEHPRLAEFTQLVTQENFDQLLALHQAMEDGDRESAKAIAEEIGLPKPEHKGKMMHGSKSGRHSFGPRSPAE